MELLYSGEEWADVLYYDYGPENDLSVIELDTLILARSRMKYVERLIFDHKKGVDRRVGEELVSRLASVGETEHRVAGLVARLREGRTPDTLDERLLVEAGVSADVIAKCRVPGRSYVFVEIRKEKES